MEGGVKNRVLMILDQLVRMRMKDRYSLCRNRGRKERRGKDE